MTWLAVVAISLAVAIFVAGRRFREKSGRIREQDKGRSYESRYRFAPRRGDDMKKWEGRGLQSLVADVGLMLLSMLRPPLAGEEIARK